MPLERYIFHLHLLVHELSNVQFYCRRGGHLAASVRGGTTQPASCPSDASHLLASCRPFAVPSSVRLSMTLGPLQWEASWRIEDEETSSENIPTTKRHDICNPLGPLKKEDALAVDNALDALLQLREHTPYSQTHSNDMFHVPSRACSRVRRDQPNPLISRVMKLCTSYSLTTVLSALPLCIAQHQETVTTRIQSVLTMLHQAGRIWVASDTRNPCKSLESSSYQVDVTKLRELWEIACETESLIRCREEAWNLLCDAIKSDPSPNSAPKFRSMRLSTVLTCLRSLTQRIIHAFDRWDNIASDLFREKEPPKQSIVHIALLNSCFSFQKNGMPYILWLAHETRRIQSTLQLVLRTSACESLLRLFINQNNLFERFHSPFLVVRCSPQERCLSDTISLYRAMVQWASYCLEHAENELRLLVQGAQVQDETQTELYYLNRSMVWTLSRTKAWTCRPSRNHHPSFHKDPIQDTTLGSKKSDEVQKCCDFNTSSENAATTRVMVPVAHTQLSWSENSKEADSSQESCESKELVDHVTVACEINVQGPMDSVDEDLRNIPQTVHEHIDAESCACIPHREDPNSVASLSVDAGTCTTQATFPGLRPEISSGTVQSRAIEHSRNVIPLAFIEEVVEQEEHLKSHSSSTSISRADDDPCEQNLDGLNQNFVSAVKIQQMWKQWRSRRAAEWLLAHSLRQRQRSDAAATLQYYWRQRNQRWLRSTLSGDAVERVFRVCEPKINCTLLKTNTVVQVQTWLRVKFVKTYLLLEKRQLFVKLRIGRILISRWRRKNLHMRRCERAQDRLQRELYMSLVVRIQRWWRRNQIPSDSVPRLNRSESNSRPYGVHVQGRLRQLVRSRLLKSKLSTLNSVPNVALHCYLLWHERWYILAQKAVARSKLARRREEDYREAQVRRAQSQIRRYITKKQVRTLNEAPLRKNMTPHNEGGHQKCPHAAVLEGLAILRQKIAEKECDLARYAKILRLKPFINDNA